MARFDWNLHWIMPVAAISCPALGVDYLSAVEAQKILFPTADRFEEKKVALSDAQLDRIKELSGVRQREHNPKIWQAYQGKTLQGFFFVDDVIGKHEFITYAAAISPDDKVLGVEVMSYRETHGGEVRRPDWLMRFKGKTLKDPFKLDQDIPNISGATLSCRNLVDGVKRLLVLKRTVENA
jgi:Na+-translocating ferredoxin:NAD+ oxidoreductase RnfG subunit